MAFFNKIVPVNQSWEWPQEDIQRIETDTLTDAEGSIIINYDGITQLDDISENLFLVTPPSVPETKYTKLGGNVNFGPQIDTDIFLLSTGRLKVNWRFVTTIVNGVADGQFYLVELEVNLIIRICFIIKIVNVSI